MIPEPSCLVAALTNCCQHNLCLRNCIFDGLYGRGDLGWSGSWFLCLVLFLSFCSCVPFSPFHTLTKLGSDASVEWEWGVPGAGAACGEQFLLGQWWTSAFPHRVGDVGPGEWRVRLFLVLIFADFYIYFCGLFNGSQRNTAHISHRCYSEWTGGAFGGEKGVWSVPAMHTWQAHFILVMDAVHLSYAWRIHS